MGRGNGPGKQPGKGRLAALAVVCAAVFALFAARLGWMQFAMAAHYAEKVAEAGQVRYQVTLPAARGDIVDTNGAVLAQDTTVWDVSLCLPAPPGTDLEETIKTLETQGLTAEGGEDVETQLAAFFAAASAGELPLAGGLSQAQAAKLYAAGLPQSSAVRLTARGVRTRPDGALLPHALGDTGAITAEQWQADNYALQKAGVAMNADIGQSGLEKVYDELLRGRSGTLLVHAGYDGTRAEQLLKQPQAGATLVLTLDSELQRTVQAAAAGPHQSAAGARRRRRAGMPGRCGRGRGCADRRRAGGGLLPRVRPEQLAQRLRRAGCRQRRPAAGPRVQRAVCAGLGFQTGGGGRGAGGGDRHAAGHRELHRALHLFTAVTSRAVLQISHAGPVGAAHGAAAQLQHLFL